MKNTYRIASILSITCVVAGFLLPLWQLALIGVVLAGATGRYALAVGMGVLLDLLYGAPPGVLHGLAFPFTLAAAVAVLLRGVGKKYFLDKTFPGRV